MTHLRGKLRFGALAVATLLLSACGEGGPGQGVRGLGSDFSRWTLGSSYNLWVRRIVADGEGGAWALGQQFSRDGGFRGVLWRFGSRGEGNRATSYRDSGFLDVAAVPGGVVVLEARPTGVADEHFGKPADGLYFVRLDGQGERTAEWEFRDIRQEEALYYTSGGSRPSRPLASDRTLFLSRQVGNRDYARLTSWQDRIALSVTGRMGFKIFVYDLSGTLLWQREIAPFSEFNGALMLRSAPPVAFDESGNLFTAIDIHKEEVGFFLTHFGESPAWRGDDRQILLRKYDPRGELVGSRVIGSRHPDTVHELRPADGRLWVLGSAWVEKADGSGTREYDVLLTGMDTSLDRVAVQRVFDVEREDLITEIDVDESGDVYLGGTCGFEQAATHSVISYGELCVLRLSSRGEVLASRKLGTSRHDRLGDLRVKAVGRVQLGGSLDGPITHSTQTTFEGFAGELSL